MKKIWIHLGLRQTRNDVLPQIHDAPIPSIETEPTEDSTSSQLPPIDYRTQ